MDNFNSRQYYMDQDIMVVDSPRLGCPILHMRKVDTPLTEILTAAVKKVLQTCRMVPVSGEFETYEGFKFLRLKPIN